MTPTPQVFLRETAATLRDPRAMARRIMAVDMSRRDRWLVLFLVAVVSTVTGYLSFALNARVAGLDLTDSAMAMPPFEMAVSQALVMVIMVFAIDLFGRALGGKGKLDDAILLVSWVQAILVGLQIVQIVLGLVFPLLGVLAGFAGIFLLFWLLTQFIAEMHGFRSAWAVFFVMLVATIAIATLLRMIFSVLGWNMMGMI